MENTITVDLGTMPDLIYMIIKDESSFAELKAEFPYILADLTTLKTNPNCMRTLGSNAIYTNVALTPDMEPWWEGIDGEKPASLIDWQGRSHDPANGPAALTAAVERFVADLVAAASSAYFWMLSRLDSGGLVWWLVAIPGLLLQLWLVMWI